MDFSFVILTYNEEIHLRRLLDSIKSLNADVFILDSGSKDKTFEIADQYNATVKIHSFVNHPKQWNYALTAFHIITPWVICLDADQVVTPSLYNKLLHFDDKKLDSDINAIYFNRHNFFKGRRLMYGGYRNKYLLKMFRTGVGLSDQNENMDHRFIVPGRSMIWKDGIVNEENLKENNISFWIEKHNRYSNLTAREEMERLLKLRNQSIKPALFGNPDQKTALLKSIWWKLPLFIRPFIYFTYRFIFLGGILDGKHGVIFHFLQAFWFRLVVDIKISELKKENKVIELEDNSLKQHNNISFPEGITRSESNILPYPEINYK